MAIFPPNIGSARYFFITVKSPLIEFTGGFDKGIRVRFLIVGFFNFKWKLFLETGKKSENKRYCYNLSCEGLLIFPARSLPSLIFVWSQFSSSLFLTLILVPIHSLKINKLGIFFSGIENVAFNYRLISDFNKSKNKFILQFSKQRIWAYQRAPSHLRARTFYG